MPKRLIITIFFVLCAYAHGAELRPKPHEGYEVKDDKILFRRGNAGLIVEVATPAKIEQYYRERGSQMANPLGNLTAGMQNPAFFLVTLLNRTNGNLTFTPRYVIARIKTEAYFPLDYLSMMEVMEDQEPGRRKLLEKSIFHSPELLESGKIVSKFLIFPELPKKFEEIRLSFDYLYFENTEIKSDFIFTTKLGE
jgi:hypothetical protein